MKKHYFLVLAVLSTLAIVFGCSHKAPTVAQKYTVTFVANSANVTGEMAPQTFTEGEAQNLSPNAFSRADYTFSGWATSADGTVLYKNKASFTATSNITLYAVWFETYMTFGEWPQSVLPEGTTVTISDTETKTVGLFTYYKGSDENWYVKQAEKAYGTGEAYKYSDGSVVKQASENSTRYFKVEPIKWRVLEEKSGKKFLLAENGLMALPYYDIAGGTRTIGTETDVHSNNYKHSKIRAFLNGYKYQLYDADNAEYEAKGFLQTAFTSEAQAKIATTTVDNSVASTLYSSNPYVCDETNDKVFLLSAKESTIASYGFSTSTNSDNARIRKPTDFALATGAYNVGGAYGGDWWLRSPYYYYDYGARYIYYDGFVHYDYYVAWGGGAVVPALWLEP